ncbi:MAG: hypothetical protein ACTSWW_13495 [Promethearchaeota archaeon]
MTIIEQLRTGTISVADVRQKIHKMSEKSPSIEPDIPIIYEEIQEIPQDCSNNALVIVDEEDDYLPALPNITLPSNPADVIAASAISRTGFQISPDQVSILKEFFPEKTPAIINGISVLGQVFYQNFFSDEDGSPHIAVQASASAIITPKLRRKKKHRRT